MLSAYWTIVPWNLTHTGDLSIRQPHTFPNSLSMHVSRHGPQCLYFGKQSGVTWTWEKFAKKWLRET